MRHRVGQIFLLIGTTGLVASGSGQELDQDDSPDYSTIFQQFLLQKIKEGDVWSNADYDNSEFPLRARQEDLEKATQIDEDLEDEDDDNVTETVINEAPYQMTSENGEISANIRLQQVFGSDLLTLLCRVTADDDSDLFSDKNCLPEVYLVAGQSDCENLPQVRKIKVFIQNIFETSFYKKKETRLPASRSSSIGPEGCFSFSILRLRSKKGGSFDTK